MGNAVPYTDNFLVEGAPDPRDPLARPPRFKGLPLYIAGTRVIASYPFGPRTGTALNATVLSYCDDLHLGMNIDPAAITDVKVFMSDIDASFDAFLQFA